MAITYLRHPQHGTKTASMQAEIDHDYKNGWEEYDPNEKEVVEETPVVEKEVVEETTVVENTLAPRSRRKTAQ